MDSLTAIQPGRHYTSPDAELIKGFRRSKSLSEAGNAMKDYYLQQWQATANTLKAVVGRPTGNGPITPGGMFIEDARHLGIPKAVGNALTGEVRTVQNFVDSFSLTPRTPDKSARQVIRIPSGN